MNNSKSRLCAGFSLIELAIVITIAGLLMSTVLSFIRINSASRTLGETKENLRLSEKSLKSFFEMNGHYPCPAGRNLSQADKNYGRSVETCPTPEDTVVVNLKNPLLKDGTVLTAGRNGYHVRIGIIPFRNLGIADSRAVDGYGRLLQYAITEKLTNPNTFRQKDGAIDVLAEDNISRVSPPGSVQYVIFSTGANGAGGFSTEGKPYKECQKKSLETENCDNDATFVDARQKFRSAQGKDGASTDYDDFIVYRQYDPDAEEKNGLLLQYYGACPKDFEEIALQDGARVRDLQKVNFYPPSDRRYLSSMGPGKERICASSRYALIMSVSTRQGASNCPPQWTGIGYGIFPKEGAASYEICVR